MVEGDGRMVGGVLCSCWLLLKQRSSMLSAAAASLACPSWLTLRCPLWQQEYRHIISVTIGCVCECVGGGGGGGGG